jgi:hypothetical protein
MHCYRLQLWMSDTETLFGMQSMLYHGLQVTGCLSLDYFTVKTIYRLSTEDICDAW